MPATNDDHGWAALESGTVTADVGLGIVYRTSTGQRCETPTRLGYGRVMVQRTPRTIYVMAHRLIWMAAHGPIPSGDLQVNHINKRPWDNRIVNLELVTAGGNISHSQDRWYVALTNDDPAWSSNDIRLELRRQGVDHDLREGSMQRHRRYDCRCRPQP